MPFTLGPVIPCEAPASAVSYVESGEAWGLEAGPEPDGAHLDGGGVAVHDFDGDGDLDLVLAFAFGDLLYYQREGDGFVRGVLDEGHLGGLMGLGDADGDGDVDLLLPKGCTARPFWPWSSTGRSMAIRTSTSTTTWGRYTVPT